MEVSHRKLLQKYRKAIARDLDPQQILGYLMACLDTFTEDDEDEVKSMESRSARVEKLLDILPRKEPSAFECFVRALQKECPHLAKPLLKESQDEQGVGPKDSTVEKQLSEERRQYEVFQEKKKESKAECDSSFYWKKHHGYRHLRKEESLLDPNISRAFTTLQRTLKQDLFSENTRKAELLLQRASKTGQGDLIRYVLQSQSSLVFMLTEKDRDGLTVLHHAAQQGHGTLVRELMNTLGFGGDYLKYELLLAKDNSGRIALHHALLNDHIDVVEIILQSDSHLVDKQDKNRMSSLHYAAKQGNAKMVGVLLKANASVVIFDNSGKAALHHAVQAIKHQAQIAQTLLKHGSKTEIYDVKSATPMHYAAQSGYCEVIELLAKHGADVNCLDENEATPLHYAVTAKKHDAVKTLLLKGSNPKITDRSGKTAAAHAVCYSDGTIKETLTNEEKEDRFRIQKNVLELILAAKQNDQRKAEDLLEEGVSVNCCNWKGTTPLHSSAQAGHVATTNYLLKSGANINQKDKNGKSPLHYAVQGDFVEVVDLLLSNGAVADIVDNMRKRPLYYAIRNSSLKLVQMLFREKPDPNQHVSKYITVLHEAVQDGNPEIIQMLLKEKPSLIDLSDEEGKTVLHYAAQSGSPEKIQMLLKEKPKFIHRSDHEGKTVLHDAVQRGSPEIIQMLLKEKTEFIHSRDHEGKTALHYAAQSGSPEIFQMLLKEKPEFIHRSDYEGKTALHYAAQSGSPEIIQMLLTENPECIHWRDYEGKTVLHYAAQGGSPELFQVLLKGQPEFIHRSDHEGKTVLHYAVQGGSPEIIQMLLKEKTEFIHWRDHEGKTALHYAVQGGSPEITQMLLKEKPSLIDLSNEESETALHYAVQGGSPEIIPMLLKEKPSLIDSSDSEGKTVLHYAAQSIPEVVSLSLLKKPNLHVKDNEGKIPMVYARASGGEMSEKLIEAEGGVQVAYCSSQAKSADILTEANASTEWQIKECFGTQPEGDESRKAAEQTSAEYIHNWKLGKLEEQKQSDKNQASKFLELQTRTRVDSRGGVIELGDCSLTIPVGSLYGSQDISLTLEDPVRHYGVFDDAGLFPSVVIASPVIKLGPSGLQFTHPSLLEAKLCRPTRDDEDITVLCGSHVEDENGGIKVVWEDVTSQSIPDENCENISVKIHHFTWYVVLYKSVVILTKALLSRLNLISFKYHMVIFTKRDHPQDSYCDLRLVFMSADIYWKASNYEQEETILTRWEKQGYEQVSNGEGSYVYAGQVLAVHTNLNTGCRLGPFERDTKEVVVDASTWWDGGTDVSFTLQGSECSHFGSGWIEVEGSQVPFNANDMCRYVKNVFKIDKIANLLPLADKLHLSEEEKQWIVRDNWEDDKNQLEKIVKSKFPSKSEDSLERLKRSFGNLNTLEELHVNRRGQMNVVNLREFKKSADTVRQDEEASKLNYLNERADELLTSFLWDCCIQTVSSCDKVKSVETGLYHDHLFERQCITRDVYKKLQELTPRTFGYHQQVSNLVPTLIQVAKEVFVETKEEPCLTGLWGLFVDDYRSIEKAVIDGLRNDKVTQLIECIFQLLVQLCLKNERYLLRQKGITKEHVNEWLESLNLIQLLNALDDFMTYGEALHTKMRIKRLGSQLKKILVNEARGRQRLREISNLAFCLIDFARFVPSRLVHFHVKQDDAIIDPINDIIMNKDHIFQQKFLLERCHNDQTQLSCSAEINMEGELVKVRILKVEMASHDIHQLHKHVTKRLGNDIKLQLGNGATLDRMLLHGTNRAKLCAVLDWVGKSSSCSVSKIKETELLKVIHSNSNSEEESQRLTLLYHWRDEGITFNEQGFEIGFEENISVDREETTSLVSEQSQAVVSQNGPCDIEGGFSSTEPEGCSRQVTNVVTSALDQMNTYREVKSTKIANGEATTTMDSEQARALITQDAHCETVGSLLSTSSTRQIAETVTSALDQSSRQGKQTQIVVVLQDQRQMTTVNNNQDQRQTTVNNQQTYESECYGPTAIGDQSSLHTTEGRQDNNESIEN